MFALVPSRCGEEDYAGFAHWRRVSYIWSTERQQVFPLIGTCIMSVLYPGAAALIVAAIYYLWRAYFTEHRKRMLRSRVTYMLWVMSQHVQ
jgi:hypothetical protein